MIINLTPHDIDIYGTDAPDVIRPGMNVAIQRTLPASGEVARIVESVTATSHLRREQLDITLVEYGHVTGLPPYSLDAPRWYVVSLATALAKPEREDLLVPWRQVRNAAGTVIGCRGLALPV